VETRTETPRAAEGRPLPPIDRTPEEKLPSRRRPPYPLIAIGVVVLVIALIFGARFLAYATTHESTDDARIDSDTVTLTSKITERVRRVLVDANQSVTKGQVLVQLDDTDERAKYDQAVAAVNVQRAQARAAQANVALTSQQQEAQSAQGSGGVAVARSQIENAEAQYKAQNHEVAVAQAAVAQAAAQLHVAQAQVPSAREGLNRANADFSRVNALVRTGDVAQQQLDASRAGLAQAQAQYQAALDQVAAAQTGVVQAQSRVTAAVATANAARAGIGAQHGQLVTAQGRLSESAAPARVPAAQAQADAAVAQVASLEAQATVARNQLAYTVIRSPIDGFVGAKDVDVGTTVSPGQALLQLVPAAGRQYVTANFKETQIGNMRVGQPVDISIDAYKGVRFEGKVSSLGPASQNTFSLIPPQNATGNFVKVTQRVPVRIDFVNPPSDKPLRVGMSVVASVRVK
jgi:membrane fusion protein (multidrug efflux system)